MTYVLWYIMVFRPSGEERWGDGASIFYLGAITYPLSLALLIVGAALAVRWRRKYPGRPTAGPILFAASWFQLFAPVAALLVASIASGP